MDSRGKKTLVIITSILVISAGISAVIIFNLEKVQEIYESLIGDEDSDEDSNGPDVPDELPGESKPISQALNRLLSSTSARKIGSLTTVVSSNSEFFPLIGTPIAVGYSDTIINSNPLLIAGEAASNFLDVYNDTGIITIGDVGEVPSDVSITGDEKSASLEAAKQIWSYSDGALVIENSKEGYEIGLVATVLASYLNIPVIVTNTMDDSVVETLSNLGVSYILVCGNLKGYGETYYLSSLDYVYDLSVEFLKIRFGKVSSITVTNSQDVYSDYGIAKISCLAPYLSSSHGGVVLNCPVPRLSSNIFSESGEVITDAANNTYLLIKTEIEKLLGKFKNLGVYSNYITDSPYLAILGDPYSLPFYYFEDPDPGNDPGDDDIWLATDDYYADLDNNPYHLELAVGRVLALSLGGVSALLSRSLFYTQYMEQWEADSQVSDIKDAEWKNTAYAAKGDDWNGAIWVSTYDYWAEVKYLQDNGYTVHTTQRRATGATVSQEILHYYSSSSMIYVIAHGTSDGYQMTDGVDSRDVKNWDMGPSVQVLTSCSAARTDVPDIEETISLTFIEVGVNAYIGGVRTETSGSSPILSGYFIELTISSDETVGLASRDAKNQFMKDSDYNYDRSAIRVLYADPAFDPYQP
jgi:hypothetical protein